MLGVLIAGFARLEVSKRAEALAFGRRSLPLGGALSGCLGGLSGRQGALRSAFLPRLGLSKQAFIGTSVVSAWLGSLTGARLVRSVTLRALQLIVAAMLLLVAALLAAGII